MTKTLEYKTREPGLIAKESRDWYFLYLGLILVFLFNLRIKNIFFLVSQRAKAVLLYSLSPITTSLYSFSKRSIGLIVATCS